MKTSKNIFFILISFCFILTHNFNAYAQEESEIPSDIPENVVLINNNKINFLEQGQIEFVVDVHEGFFAYLDKFKLDIKGFSVSNLQFDPIVTFYDKTFKKNKEGVKNSAKATAIIKLLPKTEITTEPVEVILSYQACTPEYCLFPSTTEFQYQFNDTEKTILNRTKAPSWMNNGVFYALLFIFLTGLLTSLTPCVYPLIPITLAVLGREKSDTKLKGFSKSLIYVLGLALTYSTLGIIAATSGFMFGSLLSNIYFITFLSLILFVAALSMYDVFEIKSPAFLNRFQGNQGKSLIGIFISGAFSGLVVGPCVGPVLVGILSYVSTTGNLLMGFSFLFSFAMGLGSLIIVLGTFSNLVEKLPRSGQWMIWVKKGLGIVFLLMIAYFLNPLLDLKTLIIIISTITILFGTIILVKKAATSNFEKAFFKSLVIFCYLVAAFTLTLSKERFERLVGYNASTYANTQWDVFSEEKLALAKTNGQPVILDFYADWCAACKELKHITFADKRVIDFNSNIKWLYFDSTKPSPKLDEYKKKYSIMGLPTILFFDKAGNLREDLTLTGFEKPDKFLERLSKL